MKTEFIKVLNGLTFTGFLLVCAVDDYRSRTIRLKMCRIFTAAGLILSVLGHREIKEIGLAILPGMLLMLLSAVTGGGLGSGDAIFVLVGALYRKCSEIILSVSLTWIFCAIISLLVLVGCFGRKTGKIRGIPFISVMLLAETVLFMVRIAEGSA